MLKKVLVLFTLCAFTLSCSVFAADPIVVPDDQADAEGTVSFENINSRMHKKNLAILSCQEQLDRQAAFDREKNYNDLVDMINSLADASWVLGNVTDVPPGVDATTAHSQAAELSKTISSLRTQLDSLKKEEYDKFYEELTRQMQTTMDQVILGAETLYLNILNCESQLSDLTRALTALDRSHEELELRHKLGQVSQISLRQLESSIASTKNQSDSLRLSMSNMKANLQSMLGETPNGQLLLTKTPMVTTEMLRALSYDRDLDSATTKSLTIFQANKAMDTAQETYDDMVKRYIAVPEHSALIAAKHDYQVATYTHTAAIQSFQLSFHTLYSAVPAAQTALTAAQAALDYQDSACAIAEVKHKQGKLSTSALLTAKEDREAAYAVLMRANISLILAHNNYRAAVDHGIVK
ncbi:MAG: TolC family protein [Evtepia sp.]